MLYIHCGMCVTDDGQERDKKCWRECSKVFHDEENGRFQMRMEARLKSEEAKMETRKKNELLASPVLFVVECLASSVLHTRSIV